MPLTSPARAARRTVLQKVRGPPLWVPQFVNTGFQVLFHSPPGVLFTFPSQYCPLSVTEEYLALRGGPRSFRQDSSCPGVLRILPLLSGFAYGALTPFGRSFQYRSARLPSAFAVLTPERLRSGLGSFPFARRYSGNRCFFLFLRLLRCFSSPGSPRYAYVFSIRCTGSARAGFPIQTSADHRACAAPRSFSQLATSFFGSQCQGILPALFLLFPPPPHSVAAAVPVSSDLRPSGLSSQSS